MRPSFAVAGMALAAGGFSIFFVILAGFGVRTAPAFAFAALGALAVGAGLLLRRRSLAVAGAALIALVFLWLQLSRPAFSLSLSTLGSLLVASGGATAAVELARGPVGDGRSRCWGWWVAAAGGVVFLPGNMETRAAFVLADALATVGFALGGLDGLGPDAARRD